jgi:isopentenyl diphosphate isomerase/L-lactate dehydrogenase-like FMN-dependent dehydrogenase
VGGEADVLLDGGVRRGTDVVKALALGATACLVGRPWVYGLAAGGTEGVVRLLEILHDEIDRTLALIGRPGVSTLDASAIWTPPAQPWVRTGHGTGDVLEPVGRS